MSIGFLCGVSSGTTYRPTTRPHSRSSERKSNYRVPTREESMRQRIAIWREVDPAYAQALESLAINRGIVRSQGRKD